MNTEKVIEFNTMNMPSHFQKIMLIGIPGSGKSTYAIKLQKLLGYPLLHLDKIFYTDHWKENDYEAFLRLQQQFIDQPTWIIDGNSTKSYELRYSEADICLYFNFPKWQCYWRVFKRLFHKHPDIDDRANNCGETVRWSLLKYMWSFQTRVRVPLQYLRLTYPDVQFFEFKSIKDIEHFERNLFTNIGYCK